MITVIKKGYKKHSILKLLKELKQKAYNKGFDAYKYCGAIQIAEDPLEIQKRMRDEWE